jgi:hypothetical protein
VDKTQATRFPSRTTLSQGEGECLKVPAATVSFFSAMAFSSWRVRPSSFNGKQGPVCFTEALPAEVLQHYSRALRGRASLRSLSETMRFTASFQGLGMGRPSSGCGPGGYREPVCHVQGDASDIRADRDHAVGHGLHDRQGNPSRQGLECKDVRRGVESESTSVVISPGRCRRPCPQVVTVLSRRCQTPYHVPAQKARGLPDDMDAFFLSAPPT